MTSRSHAPPGSGRRRFLALGCLIGSLFGSSASAASYFEGGRSYYFSSGEAQFGHSVDVASGALQLRQSLGTLPGRMPISCGWLYNAQDATDGPLGKGTSTSWDWFLEPYGDSYQLIGPGNRRYMFRPTGVAGQYKNTTTPEVLGAVLTISEPYVYGVEPEIRFKDGSKFCFNGFNYRDLTRATNAHGWGISYIWRNAQGYPTQIQLIYGQSSASERSINFTYGANGKLASMNFKFYKFGSAQDRTWTFSYDGSNRLSSVTAPDTGVTSYTWTTYTRSDGQVLPLVATITNPRGYVELANQYDTSGRVTRQTFADNAFLTASYSAAITSAGTTTVTDPRSNVSAWTYAWFVDSLRLGYNIASTQNALNRVTTYARGAAPTTLVTAVTDFRNRQATMQWDTALGNLLSVTRPPPTARRPPATPPTRPASASSPAPRTRTPARRTSPSSPATGM